MVRRERRGEGGGDYASAPAASLSSLTHSGEGLHQGKEPPLLTDPPSLLPPPLSSHRYLCIKERNLLLTEMGWRKIPKNYQVAK
jgi:hypothetical protein